MLEKKPPNSLWNEMNALDSESCLETVPNQPGQDDVYVVVTYEVTSNDPSGGYHDGTTMELAIRFPNLKSFDLFVREMDGMVKMTTEEWVKSWASECVLELDQWVMDHFGGHHGVSDIHTDKSPDVMRVKHDDEEHPAFHTDTTKLWDEYLTREEEQRSDVLVDLSPLKL